MNTTQNTNPYSSIVNVLVYLFPFAILLVKESEGLILLILSMVGIYVILKEKINPLTHTNLRLTSWLTLSYFGVIILSILMSDKSTELFGYVDRSLHFIFAPLIAVALFKATIDINKLILTMKFSLIVLGMYIGYQYFTIDYSNIDWVLSRGITPIIILLMLSFTWVNIKNEENLSLLLSMLTTLMTINVILMANGRSAFIGFIVIMLIFIYFEYKTKESNFKKVVLFGVSSIFFAIIALTNYHKFTDRLEMAVENVTNWTQQSDSGNISSSVIRLEMYRGGIQAFFDKPIFGHGYRNTTQPADKYTNKSNLPHSIAKYNFLHNTIIDAIVSGGIIGLIALLSLWLLPFLQFWKEMLKGKDNAYSKIGVLLITGFIVMSATNSMLGGVAQNAFFIFFLSLSLSQLHKKTTT